MNKWAMVGSLSDFEVDFPEEVTVDGARVAVHRTSEGVFATAALCTHEEERLADGFLEGCEVVCPRHLARFDVRTGEPRRGPAKASLVTYPCEVRATEVWVSVSSDDEAASP